MKRFLWSLLLCSIPASVWGQSPEVFITSTMSPSTLEGFTTFVLGLQSDRPISVVDATFSGTLNQVNPFGLPTVFNNNNAAFDDIPEEPGDDSQFLFSSTGGPLVVPSESQESDSLLSAVFAINILPAPFDPTNFDFVQLVLPPCGFLDFDIELVIEGELVNLFGSFQGAPKTKAFGSPSPPRPIDLTPAFLDSSGLLDDAINLANPNGPFGDLGGFLLEIRDDANGLFGAELDGQNIDLTLDVAAARRLAPSQQTATLIVASENAGSLVYDLVVNIPEPTTVSMAAVMLLAFSVRGPSERRVT